MTDQPSDQPPPGGPSGGEPPPAWQQPAWGQQPSPYGQQPPPYGQQPPAYGQQPPAGQGEPGHPGQQWGPPSPGATYGYPGYGAYGPAVPQTAGRATTVMVLGIVSLVMMFTCGLGFVTAIIALVMAPAAKREIADSGGRLTGETQVRTGTIMSWITLALTALALLVFAVVIGIVVSVDDATGGAEPALVTPG